jgi:hypothetical protein
MRLLIGLCSVLAWLCAASGQLAIQGLPAVQDVFGGRAGVVVVTISNKSAERSSAKLGYRLFQLTSSTAAPVNQVTAWKELELLPGQTVIEEIAIEVPEVKAPTGFRIQVLDGEQKALGAAVVRALPEKALASVNEMVGGAAVGLLAQNEELVAALRRLGLHCEVLKADTIDQFNGPLVIFDGCNAKAGEAAAVRNAMDRTKTDALILTKAPADQLDRLKLIRGEFGTKTELSLQPTEALGESATFAWRLIEAAKATVEARR